MNETRVPSLPGRRAPLCSTRTVAPPPHGSRYQHGTPCLIRLRSSGRPRAPAPVPCCRIRWTRRRRGPHSTIQYGVVEGRGWWGSGAVGRWNGGAAMESGLWQRNVGIVICPKLHRGGSDSKQSETNLYELRRCEVGSAVTIIEHDRQGHIDHLNGLDHPILRHDHARVG